MPAYYEYLLKAAVCLAIIYLFYFLLLRRLTCYTLNRYFLLCFSLVSFVIPFVDISVLVEREQQTSGSLITLVPSVNMKHVSGIMADAEFFRYEVLLVTVVPGVSCILLLRLALQLLSLQKIKARAVLIESGDVHIYRLPEPMVPFSFLNSIFVNTDDYTPTELAEIIGHEKVHVKQQHTIDVLITEMICILNWFNPFAWLIRTAVRENLEYIADDVVIRKGADIKSYQYLLLKVTGENPSGLANCISFSSLKNRMVMMNKASTPGFKLFRLILLIPVIGLIVLAFRDSTQNPPGSVETKTASNVNYILQTLTYSIPDNRVQAIVTSEKHKSFLKPGSVFRLEHIYDEKKRLLTLLDKNGYRSLKSNAVMFWVDTTSVRNRFLVEVRIDVDPPPNIFPKYQTKYFSTAMDSRAQQACSLYKISTSKKLVE